MVYNIRKEFKQTLIDMVQKKGKNECWPWKGYTDKNGHGIAAQTTEYGSRSTRKRKMWRAHTAYLVFVEHDGRLKLSPQDIVVHTCGTPSCCNPAHLTVVKERRLEKKIRLMANHNRKVTKKQLKKISRDESNLTDEKVRLIKRLLFKHKISRMEIEDRFHLSKATLRYIVEYKNWKHIAPFHPIKTVKGLTKKDEESIELRRKIRLRGMKRIAKEMDLTISELREIAYPLRPDYEYR